MSEMRFREALARELKTVLQYDEIALLPRGYQRIGDIIVINLSQELWRNAAAIGDAILRIVADARTVCMRERGVTGWLRKPSLRVIAGDFNTETIHKENGCVYRLDVASVMFAKGNVHERGRIAHLVGDSETVVDMFAGIGYFTIPIAVHARPSRIYAIEIDSTSFRFLQENIELNRAHDVVTPIMGDCRKVAPQLSGVAHRVIMGYYPGTEEYLDSAFQVLREEGGVIHYHNVYPKATAFNMAMSVLREHAHRWGYQLSSSSLFRVVKSYMPHMVHVVVDAHVSPTEP
ncbi:MAG: class I SAM-dependent methyltransferase [Candidatus Thorarchaeota archaeon]